MTTARGEISSGRVGEMNKQLTGKIFLCQRRAEWPIVVCTAPGEVIAWLAQNPDGAAWEYGITPVRRLYVHKPEPYLAEGNPNAMAAEPEKEKA